MASSLVKCNKCQATLFPESFNNFEFAPCPACQSQIAIEIYPAILKSPVGAVSEPLMAEGQSSCFYHPTKKASIVCEGCGRFLCGLCDLEVNGRHVCPVCLESGQKKSKFKDLENTRVLWDHLSLMVALAPLIFIWTSIVGAPIALYLVLRYRKAPCSLTGKSNLMFALAAILAILQIGGWTTVLILALTK